MKFAKSISTRWPIAHVCSPCSKNSPVLCSSSTIPRALENAVAALDSATPRTVSYRMSAITNSDSCNSASEPPFGSQRRRGARPVRCECQRRIPASTSRIARGTISRNIEAKH